MSTDSAPAPPTTTSGRAAPPSPSRPRRAERRAPARAYRELVVEALGRGRNAIAIWQDLVDDHGFAARYASVQRFVSALRSTPLAEARVVISTAPGEEGQVDYGGDGPMATVPLLIIDDLGMRKSPHTAAEDL